MDLLKKMKTKVAQKTSQLVDSSEQLFDKTLDKVKDQTIRRFNHEEVAQQDSDADRSSDSNEDGDEDEGWAKQKAYGDRKQRRARRQSNSLLPVSRPSVTIGGKTIRGGGPAPKRTPAARRELVEVEGVRQNGSIPGSGRVQARRYSGSSSVREEEPAPRTRSVTIGTMAPADAAMDDELKRAADMIQSIEIKRGRTAPGVTEIDTSDSWAAVPEDSPTTAQYDPMIQAELQAQPLRTALAEFEGGAHVVLDGNDKVIATSAFFDSMPERNDSGGLFGCCFSFGRQICPSKSEKYEVVASD